MSRPWLYATTCLLKEDSQAIPFNFVMVAHTMQHPTTSQWLFPAEGHPTHASSRFSILGYNLGYASLLNASLATSRA